MNNHGSRPDAQQSQGRPGVVQNYGSRPEVNKFTGDKPPLDYPTPNKGKQFLIRVHVLQLKATIEGELNKGNYVQQIYDIGGAEALVVFVR